MSCITSLFFVCLFLIIIFCIVFIHCRIKQCKCKTLIIQTLIFYHLNDLVPYAKNEYRTKVFLLVFFCRLINRPTVLNCDKNPLNTEFNWSSLKNIYENIFQGLVGWKPLSRSFVNKKKVDL